MLVIPCFFVYNSEGAAEKSGDVDVPLGMAL